MGKAERTCSNREEGWTTSLSNCVLLGHCVMSQHGSQYVQTANCAFCVWMAGLWHAAEPRDCPNLIVRCKPKWSVCLGQTFVFSPVQCLHQKTRCRRQGDQGELDAWQRIIVASLFLWQHVNLKRGGCPGRGKLDQEEFSFSSILSPH